MIANVHVKANENDLVEMQMHKEKTKHLSVHAACGDQVRGRREDLCLQLHAALHTFSSPLMLWKWTVHKWRSLCFHGVWTSV